MQFSEPNPFDLKLLVSREHGFYSNSIAFLLRREVQRGPLLIGEPVVMKERGEGDWEQRVEPTFILSFDAAQELMDALYAAGIRPRQAKDNATTVAAISKHLEDMRAITFAKVGVQKP